MLRFIIRLNNFCIFSVYRILILKNKYNCLKKYFEFVENKRLFKILFQISIDFIYIY